MQLRPHSHHQKSPFATPGKPRQGLEHNHADDEWQKHASGISGVLSRLPIGNVPLGWSRHLHLESRHRECQQQGQQPKHDCQELVTTPVEAYEKIPRPMCNLASCSKTTDSIVVDYQTRLSCAELHRLPGLSRDVYEVQELAVDERPNERTVFGAAVPLFNDDHANPRWPRTSVARFCGWRW
jgi:hypothetical protein